MPAQDEEVLFIAERERRGAMEEDLRASYPAYAQQQPEAAGKKLRAGGLLMTLVD